MLETPITYGIIALTVLISYFGFQRPSFFNRYKHHPVVEHEQYEYLRLLSSGFLHADYTHLGINMFVFYNFGTIVELILTGQYRGFEHLSWTGWTGHFIFLALYLSTVVLANLSTFYSKRTDSGYSAIGASGAVSGVLFCFVLFAPWSVLELYFFIPIWAILAAVMYLAYSQYASRRQRDNIDHAAHFWGAVAMPVLLVALKPHVATHFLDRLVNDFPL